MVGADFDSGAFGIVFQKNWQYAQIFDVNILSLAESGSLDNLRAQWFQTNACAQASVGSTSMSIESMAGLFVTFGIITIFAILLFLWNKRFILKDYLLIMMDSKDVLAKEKIFSIKSSRKNPVNHLTNPELSSSPIVYF